MHPCMDLKAIYKYKEEKGFDEREYNLRQPLKDKIIVIYHHRTSIAI